MKQWLITIDLDGTLLSNIESSSKQYLSKRNIEAIKKCISYGHKVAIVTGRPWRNTKDIYEKMGLNTIVGNYNGAHIHKPYDTGFLPIYTSINRTFFHEIINDPMLKNTYKNFLLEFDDKTYILDPDDTKMMHQFHIYDRSQVEKWELDFIMHKNPQSIVFNIKHKDENVNTYEIITHLKRKFGNALSFRYWVNEWDDMVNLEVNQKAVSKATVMIYIASYYNIPKSRTIAFGDGENDKEMLSSAEMGIAMKNASDLVKSYAKDVTDYTNNNDGVGRYLEKFFKLEHEEH